MDKQELRARFEAVTVDGEVAAQMDHLRQEAHRLADYLDDIVNDGREKSTALTHLETALFWANRAIAATNRTFELSPALTEAIAADEPHG